MNSEQWTHAPGCCRVLEWWPVAMVTNAYSRVLQVKEVIRMYFFLITIFILILLISRKISFYHHDMCLFRSWFPNAAIHVATWCKDAISFDPTIYRLLEKKPSTHLLLEGPKRDQLQGSALFPFHSPTAAKIDHTFKRWAVLALTHTYD